MAIKYSALPIVRNPNAVSLRSKQGSTGRANGIPVQPRSALQHTRRGAFATATRAWASLSAAQQGAWLTYHNAAPGKYTSRFGLYMAAMVASAGNTQLTPPSTPNFTSILGPASLGWDDTDGLSSAINVYPAGTTQYTLSLITHVSKNRGTINPAWAKQIGGLLSGNGSTFLQNLWQEDVLGDYPPWGQVLWGVFSIYQDGILLLATQQATITIPPRP